MHYRVTSVIGHVYATDFLPQFQNWEETDPKALFKAGIRKNEANPKVMGIHHFSREQMFV